jgi:antitoxin (DNA-binding transcriptional repressor) of toxin-antitoxin stability system
VSDTPDQVSNTPDDEREPLAVNAAQGGEGEGVEETRPRGPGRPASRAEAAGRSSTRRRIGIRELRQHASVYVDLAEKGYTVDITNRGRLVAQLVPAFDPGSPLERLIAAGVVEPAEEPGGVGDIEPYPSPATRQPTASEALGQTRDDQAQAKQAQKKQKRAKRVQAERADTEERR